MEITIDKFGFVKNPIIIDSEGGDSFIKESIKAIDKWRYAPKFENGQPIEAPTSVRLDFKIGS